MDVTNYFDGNDVACYHWKTYGYSMKTMHAHNEYEIHFSKCDNLRFFVDDKIYPVNRDNIFVFNSTDLHKMNVPDDVLYERYIISFKPAVARALSEPGLDLLECFERRPEGVSPRLVLSQQDADACTALADRLHAVFCDQHSFGARLELKLILGELLLIINRLFREKLTSGASFDEEVRISQHRMSSITEYIDRHFAEDIRLSDIAEYCHLDKAYLCRLFKKSTGICMTDYINYRRLSFATAQLREGASVSDVARACGFNSDAYFITAFKRTLGCTPRQYARSARQP